MLEKNLRTIAYATPMIKKMPAQFSTALKKINLPPVRRPPPNTLSFKSTEMQPSKKTRKDHLIAIRIIALPVEVRNERFARRQPEEKESR